MTVTIHEGDALTVLRTLPDSSVHCVVTSPPYWGLRAYGGDDGMIGLESTFEEHLERLVEVFREVWRVLRTDGTLWLNYGDAYAGNGKAGGGAGLQRTNRGSRTRYSAMPAGVQPKSLIGMPWRVAFRFQEEGWIIRSANIWHKRNPMPESAQDRPTAAYDLVFQLVKIPRGYYYDRHAVMVEASDNTHPRRKDGQYLARKGSDPHNNRHGSFGSQPYAGRHAITGNPHFGEEWSEPEPPKPHHDSMEARKQRHRGGNKSSSTNEVRGIRVSRRRAEPPYHEQYSTGHQGLDDTPRGKANLRNVWSIASKPYKGAHFATFPPEMVETPVKASTSARGCCPDCGAPWMRLTKGQYRHHANWFGDYQEKSGRRDRGAIGRGYNELVDVSTIGWRPTCDCYDERYRETHPEPRSARKRYQRAAWNGRWKRVRARPGLDEWGPFAPAVVLDPFAGSGTVGLVAGELGRESILIEINADYAAMARKRTAVIQPPLLPDAL